MYEPITHCQLHRIFRVGICPVLEVSVTYPRLQADCPEEALPLAVARFNRAYLRMAEGILTWSGGALLSSVEDAFREAGTAASFRFDRRVVDCRMTVEAGETGRYLLVTRTLSVGSRRGSIPVQSRKGMDRWRNPGLVLCACKKIESDPEKIQKSLEK